MTVRIGTTPQAGRQAAEAADWWRTNRPASPDLFPQELARALELLAEQPNIGRRYHHREIPGLRRLLLPATRCHLYYVHEPDKGALLILAVWSAVRGRGPGLVP